MGCKSNQYEGAIIAQSLVDNGFEHTFDINNADYFILNSCSVTQKSDNEALYTLRNAKNTNPNIKTILTGCLAQLEINSLKDIEYIDYVYGNDDKFDIAKFILSDEHYVVNDIMTVDSFNYQKLNDYSKTRYSIKIQDGCDNRCSYCVIPFARGKSRSADEEFIINQLNFASDNGFKEAVLTGIHIGQWGKEWNKSILDLLTAIENKSSIYRYRLGSLNPLEISNELLDFLKNSSKFCPHFHLSLQSACNKILRAMNRHYTVEYYLEQIDCISEMFPNIFLGSDIIAGFVGETDDDFAITVNNLKKSKLSQIHVFPYSIRSNTLAKSMDGHLPDKIKQERADIIKQISKEKYKEFINKNINTENEIIVEKNLSKNNGLLKGVTRNYLNVIIDDNNKKYLNTVQRVRIEEFNGELKAKIIC